MGISQSDLLIKRMVELMLEEIGKSPWLLDDIFSDLTEDPYVREVYGEKELNSIKEWFANNKVAVAMKYRGDPAEFPSVSIALGGSDEDDAQARLADQSTDSEILQPSKIAKPIPYVIKPFAASGYDQATGTMTVPEGVDISTVSPGMLLMDPKTGKGYPITGFSGTTGLVIKDSPALSATSYVVVPQYRFWKARREKAEFRETYHIGCHVHGLPAPLLWLHSVVLYGILRYRETLLEARGFQISSVRSTDFLRNEAAAMDAGDKVYSRWIVLTGLNLNTWLKSPRRTIETADATLTEDSNLATVPGAAQSGSEAPWTTVVDEPEVRKYTRRNPSGRRQ